MSPDVCVLTGDFTFLSKWILVTDILNQTLLTLLTLLPFKCCERFQFVVQGFCLVYAITQGFSLVCVTT